MHSPGLTLTLHNRTKDITPVPSPGQFRILPLTSTAEVPFQNADCLFRYQDTILAQIGAQVYAKCYIEGATDFIFGQNGQAWFEQYVAPSPEIDLSIRQTNLAFLTSRCDIGVLKASKGYITASGRASSSSKSYYVINKSTIAAASGNTVSSGAYYLGRPWGAYARVAFQDTSLSAAINSAGWSIWNTGDERTSNVVFGEYGNTGSGSSGTRASFATKLNAPVAIADVLGSGYASAAYFDADYM